MGFDLNAIPSLICVWCVRSLWGICAMLFVVELWFVCSVCFGLFVCSFVRSFVVRFGFVCLFGFV